MFLVVSGGFSGGGVCFVVWVIVCRVRDLWACCELFSYVVGVKVSLVLL